MAAVEAGAVVPPVTTLSFALWGLFGAFAIEGLQFNGAVQRTRCRPWRYPGEPSFGPWPVSVVIRLSIGTGLAAAAGLGDQVSGAFGAVAVGVAAPYIVEQLSRSARLTREAADGDARSAADRRTTGEADG
ncbi:hypothetical protein HNR23_002181 [Nocardiopsis mwathae]|uniref:Uncharacterized protein n=1 Tax=Nocardiopsis mwathae TaxID=1472723 RepID=A0A7W9YJ40_9ACTN|nr:hypothetical protein [Nocardiopsis mwathae]MBB6172121.1 hypothetical protein [Nocardiopsis mwathae]